MSVKTIDALSVVLNDTLLPKHKYHMRFYEIKTIKPIQPLTPAQARVNALKQQQTRAKDALTAERVRQKQAKAQERVRTAQQALAKARIN
jgi:hypothetical protein